MLFFCISYRLGARIEVTGSRFLWACFWHASSFHRNAACFYFQMEFGPDTILLLYSFLCKINFPEVLESEFRKASLIPDSFLCFYIVLKNMAGWFLGFPGSTYPSPFWPRWSPLSTVCILFYSDFTLSSIPMGGLVLKGSSEVGCATS